MLSLIHKIYKKDAVTLDIISAASSALTRAEEKIGDLYRQFFLDYATWYLEIKEDEMSLEKRLDDIDKRRAYVRARLLGVGTATKAMLEGVANTVPGVDVSIGLETNAQGSCAVLTFNKCENNKYLGLVKRAVEEMIPYHLNMRLVYEKVNWGEIKGVLWEDVKEYTWGGISESVSGTVLGGLDVDFD